MKNINPIELNEKKNDFLIIDVRSLDEYEAGHIQNATHIPLSHLSVSFLPDISRPVLFYCTLGIRGQKACEKILSENNNLNVYNLEGGLHAWEENELPIEKIENSYLSDQSKLKMIQGGMISFFSLLALLFSKIFSIIPMLLGLSLVLPEINPKFKNMCFINKIIQNFLSKK